MVFGVIAVAGLALGALSSLINRRRQARNNVSQSPTPGAPGDSRAPLPGTSGRGVGPDNSGALEARNEAIRGTDFNQGQGRRDAIINSSRNANQTPSTDAMRSTDPSSPQQPPAGDAGDAGLGASMGAASLAASRKKNKDQQAMLSQRSI